MNERERNQGTTWDHHLEWEYLRDRSAKQMKPAASECFVFD
jgi:hypothetical protein